MKRRTWITGNLAMTLTGAAAGDESGNGPASGKFATAFDAASDVLQASVRRGDVEAASIWLRHGDQANGRGFGAAPSADAIFLIASITKPISVAAVLHLVERERVRLDDPLRKFIPEFKGDGRDEVTVGHLLTHTSGLPDQLPDNASLRQRHASLDEFIQGAIRTPLRFDPGTRYGYSSMGILLASEVARRIAGKPFVELVDKTVFRPLEMTRSTLGLAPFRLDQVVRCQVENAAPESGAGSDASEGWDWNSRYWRELAAPWGGGHASAADIGRFLDACLRPPEGWLRPETVRLMTSNRNPRGVTPRGLGFGLGPAVASRGCSDQTFGHGGATGTLAWTDPRSDTTFVILATLPGRAADPHPRQVASDRVDAILGRVEDSN